MSDSLFGDLDIAGANDDPFSIPPDKYECLVTKVETRFSNSGNYGMFITYTIQSGSYKGQSVQEFKRIPTKDKPADDDDRARAFIKERLLSLGVPESRMNTLKPDDLLGIDCICQFAPSKSKGFYSVREVTTTSTTPVATTSDGPAVSGLDVFRKM